METTLLDWSVKWANITVPFIANLMVHSTIIITIGLLAKHAFRNKGAAIQSLILRVCLLTVMLNPLVTLLFHSAGITSYVIPQVPFNQLKYHRSPAQFDNNTLLSLPLIKYQHSSEETNGVIENDYFNSFPRIDKSSSEIHNNNINNNIPVLMKKQQSAQEQKYPNPIRRNGKKTSVILQSTLNNVQAQGKKLFVPLYIIVPMLVVVFSMYLLVKVIVGSLYLQYICRTAHEAHPADIKKCKIFACALKVETPRILRSHLVNRTLLTGLLKPTIILPEEEHEISMWSSDVIIHELAHLQRHDYLWNQLGQTGKILLPIQPLMWILVHQIEEISDYVCDDYVITYNSSRHVYADHLLTIAQSFHPCIPKIAAGSSFITTKSQLRKRIERILDSSENLSIKTRIHEALFILILFLSTISLMGFVIFMLKEMYDAVLRLFNPWKNQLILK